MNLLASLVAMVLLVAPIGEVSTAHADRDRPSAVFRVGTFNVDRDRGYVAWRRAIVAFRRHVDVAGLQEVNTAQKRRFLSTGGWGSYARTPGSDANPVIWDRHVFRRAGAGSVRIAGRHGSFAPSYATLVRLVHRSTGQEYAVLDVHLAWGHRATTPRLHRRAQLTGLARVARREEAAGRRVLVVGDFNVNHRNEGRDGRAGSPSRRLRPAGLVSAWDAERLRPGGGSSTRGAGYIDHVWAQDRARGVRAIRGISGGQHHPVVARYVVPTGGQHPAG